MQSFINQQSAFCLLGPQAKNLSHSPSITSWSVNKTNHFVSSSILTQDDLHLIPAPSNFHYMTKQNLQFLQSHFSLEKSKEKSVEIKVDSINLSGSHFKPLRNSFNKIKKLNLTISNNFNHINDISTFMSNWSVTSGDKYFRDFSNKNTFFLKNNYHLNCTSVFIYDNDKLVSFGVASTPINSYCTYIIGKALCLQYKGLSEYTDIMLYEKLLQSYGPFTINLGQANKKLLFYKMKFPNASIIEHYNGKILCPLIK